MVAGNQPRVPDDILKGARTLTANIVMEMGYAAELHPEFRVSIPLFQINSFIVFLKVGAKVLF